MAKAYPWESGFKKNDFKLLENAPIKSLSFLAQWFLRRSSFTAKKCSIILHYLPLKEGVALYFNKLKKLTDGRTEGQADVGQKVMRKAHFSFKLR